MKCYSCYFSCYILLWFYYVPQRGRLFFHCEGVSDKPDKIVGFGQRCHDPDKDARRTIRLTSTPNFNNIQYLVWKKKMALYLLSSFLETVR